MSIFSMVFASIHLSHALNRGVHHLGRSATFWAVSSLPGADVRLVCILDVHGHSCSCDRTASCSFQRDNRALARGSGWQTGPARSKTVYMAIAHIGGRWQRHGNVMAPMRIADCLQDTARLQEPCHGEIFCWRGEMHAKFACVRSPTAGKQRSGTALLRRGVCHSRLERLII